MNIIGICAIGVLGSLLALWLKNSTPSYALMVTLASGVVIFAAVISYVPTVTSAINNLVSVTGLSSEYTAILFKALGICFLCQFSSDICKDSGQSAIAAKVELAGKVMIVVLSLPMIQSVAQTATGLMGA